MSRSTQRTSVGLNQLQMGLNPTPFGLSLSKPCPPFVIGQDRPFDKLRENGLGMEHSRRVKRRRALTMTVKTHGQDKNVCHG